METILNNDQLISQVKSNTKDIATLKSNTKWLYKYGGVGGKGGNSGTVTSDPIVTANINGLYAVENGKDIPLNGTGSYTLNISVSKAGGKSFKIFGSYAPMKQNAGRPGSLGTKVVSFDAGYSVSYNITIPYNMNVSFTVDSGDGEFTKQITFGCITIPYTFNISFLQNNDVEYISQDGSLFLSTIKLNGLKIKFDYAFYTKCTASYNFEQNFLIESDDLYGNFDLTQQKEGSIIFNVPVEQYSEMNIGQYYFTANIKVTPDSSETFSLNPITKNYFIIPESLFLMVYTENANKHLYYNTRNSYYSHAIYDEYNVLINKEADKSINEEEKERLNEIRQNITFSDNGIIGMILKAYKGAKTNKTFTITQITITDENNNTSDLVIDYSTIYEQTAYTITPNISYTGEIKLSFTIRHQNDEKVFDYYLYCIKSLSSFDWLPNNITTNYQHYYRGGEIKGGFYNAGLSTIDLNSNLDEDYNIKLCKIPDVQLGTTFDVLINIGFQYNSINDTSKLLFDIYSSTQSETASQHIYVYQNVIKYNGQDNLDIYLPQEHKFNKVDGTKYHLLSIHKHLISNNASEVDVYIDGSLEATFTSYDTNSLYFNSIDCYPANYSVNLAEIIYVPRNINNELHNYFDDVSISQYWYKYCQVFRNNVGYNENNIKLLSSLYKLSDEANLSNNSFNISKETISDIASNIDCPILMFSIDCYAQLNNKSFKTSWFTLSNTTLRQLQVKNIYWSKGLSDISLVNISSDFNWYIDIQGTSSLARKVKNLTLFTEPTNSSYPNRLLFSPNFTMEDKNSFLPEEQFNLKADIVDSSHANNTSIGQFVNEHTTKFEDAQQQNAYAGHIKNCLTGFPVLLFIDEIINNDLGEETHTYYYYGIFNFDLGRESYFNLGYKSTEVFNDDSFTEAVNSSNNGFITYEIPNGQNQLFNSLLVAEILENNINGQNPIGGQVFDFSQFSSEKILFGDIVSETPRLVDYNGMFGKLKFSNNLGNVHGIIIDFVKNIAKSGAACFKRLNKNMSNDPYYGYEYAYSKATSEDKTESLNFVPNFIYQGDRNNAIDHPYAYPIEFKNANAELIAFINDSNNYQQQLLDTICPYQGGSEEDPPHKVHLDYNSLVEYFVTCMAFGLVDSVLKNMNIKTWTANADLSNIAKWYIAFYDMDTCLGRDNAGIKTSYFAFTDYWKSNDTILDDYIIEAQKIKIYRDFYPAKDIDDTTDAGYDIPSSYLFAIAKYANYIIGKTFWDGNNFNTPQDLWASWRQPGAILENAQSFMDKYFTNHLSKIPEALISYNYRFKYVWQTNTGGFDSIELKSFHGRGTYEVLDWLIKRFHILDAYFNLCRAKDYITFYKTDTNTWENTALTEIYPDNIAEATSNDDIVIFKSLSATNMTYTKTALSEMTFYVKAPELTPFILYLKEGAYVYRYLLNDPDRTYKITINNAGNQDFFLGGSSEWIEFAGAHALIENKVLTCISNNLQVLSATEGSCTVWNFDLPALRVLNLTSKNYGGNLSIGYGENEVTNLTSLSSIDISNSSINLNINRSNVREIIANNIESESLVIRNSNNIKRIELNNSFINNINMSNNVANLIDFSLLKFNKLEINGTGLIENSSINIIDNNINPVKILKLEDIENITIQNVKQLQQLVVSNDVIKKLTIINSNLSNINETYQESEDHEIINNSIYVETISHTDSNGQIVIDEQILHLEKLINLKSISFENTLGFTTVILPNNDEIELQAYAFYETDLHYIDFDDKQNDNHTLVLCDNAQHECRIFENSSFTMQSSYSMPNEPNEYLKFKVKNDKTSLSRLFYISSRRTYLGAHNGMPNITYSAARNFINNLENREQVISLEYAFHRQSNIEAKFILNAEDDSYNYSVDSLITLAGYSNLNNIGQMFEHTQINFVDENFFGPADNACGSLIGNINILNFMPYNVLAYMHFNALDNIKNKITQFLFTGKDDTQGQREDNNNAIWIYGLVDNSYINVHNLLFNNEESKLVELCGFNISRMQKIDLNNLFTSKENKIESIHSVFNNLNQSKENSNLYDITDFNLQALTKLTTLSKSFIAIDTTLENVDINKTIDILNYLDWNNQYANLSSANSSSTNDIFNFYKNIDFTQEENITKWNSCWSIIHQQENANYLFSNCLFMVNDNTETIQSIPYSSNSKVIRANGLFYNSTAYVKSTNEEIGITLTDSLISNLNKLHYAQNIFANCKLNGINNYPINENLLSNLSLLNSIISMFENTKIIGTHKTYNSGTNKNIFYLNNLGGSICNNYILSDSNNTNGSGYPFMPENLFIYNINLTDISNVFADSDFEGYLPDNLLINQTQLSKIDNFIYNCKILPQLYKQFNSEDNVNIYNYDNNDDINTTAYVFIPDNFIHNNDINIQNIINFNLLLSNNKHNRLYLMTNTSLNGKSPENINLTINSSSVLIGKYVYRNSDNSWYYPGSQANNYMYSENIGFINLCINDEGNNIYSEGISIDTFNSTRSNNSCLVNSELASRYYGYIFKPQTLITKANIDSYVSKEIYFMTFGDFAVNPTNSMDKQLIPLSKDIILPPIIIHSTINADMIPMLNSYGRTLLNDMYNKYKRNCLFRANSTGKSININNIDKSFIDDIKNNNKYTITTTEITENDNIYQKFDFILQYPSIQYSFTNNSKDNPELTLEIFRNTCLNNILQQIVYNNYYLLFNDWNYSIPDSSGDSLLSTYYTFALDNDNTSTNGYILLTSDDKYSKSEALYTLYPLYKLKVEKDDINNVYIVTSITKQ